MKGRPGIFSTKCVEQAPGQRVAPAERHECAQRRTPKSPRMPMPLPMRPAIAPAFVPFEESAPAYSNLPVLTFSDRGKPLAGNRRKRGDVTME